MEAPAEGQKTLQIFQKQAEKIMDFINTGKVYDLARSKLKTSSAASLSVV
jgi:hypothetical protein